jgi:hypothetical protein
LKIVDIIFPLHLYSSATKPIPEQQFDCWCLFNSDGD